MGIRTALGLTDGPVKLATAANKAPAQRVAHSAAPRFASLAAMLEDDRNGLTTGYLTKSEALKVPALSNGVTLLCAIAQQLTLKSTPSNEAVDKFLATLDPDVAPGWTLAQTIQDLMFHGAAYWLVLEETSGPSVTPRYIRHAPHEQVQVDERTGVITVGQDPEDSMINPRTGTNQFAPSDYVRFDSIVEGLLSRGYESIATALANVRQTRRYAQNPAPNVTLTDKDGADSLRAEEATEHLQSLSASVRGGGYAYVGGLNALINGWSARDLQLVEARQQDAIEMARLLTVHPRYVAAPSQGSDLTYANLAEVRRDLFEIGGLATWLVPIEQRLSLSNSDREFARRQVTPTSIRVKFDADMLFAQLQPTETPGAVL